MKNAQHNTHTHETEKLRVSLNRQNLNLGKICSSSFFEHGVDRPFGSLPLRFKTERKLFQKILRVICIRENFYEESNSKEYAHSKMFSMSRTLEISMCSSVRGKQTPRVEIALSFLISSCVLVGPRPEFPHLEKTGRGLVSTRLVFLVQKKLIGALSGSSEEFLVSLKYGKSICICRGPDQRIPICNICG